MTASEGPLAAELVVRRNRRTVRYWGGIPRGFPPDWLRWYYGLVSGTYRVTMGDRGRLVIPSELRERTGLAEGTLLTLIEAEGGLVLLTRGQLQDLVRADLAGLDLVGELLAERRAEVDADDAA